MLEALSGLAQAGALDLSQNGVGHFGIPRQHMRLYYVSVLLTGCLGICGSGHSSNRQHSLSSVFETVLSETVFGLFPIYNYNSNSSGISSCS